MTKKDIIDYVTETPHNVNRNILSQQLDALQRGEYYISVDEANPEVFIVAPGTYAALKDAVINAHPVSFSLLTKAEHGEITVFPLKSATLRDNGIINGRAWGDFGFEVTPDNTGSFGVLL